MTQNKAQGNKRQQQNNPTGATAADNFDEFSVGITDLFDSATAALFSKTSGLYLTRSLALHATYVGGLSYATSISSMADAATDTGAIITGVALSLVTTCLEIMPRQHLYFPNSAQAQAVQLGLNPVLQPKPVNTPTAKSSSYLPVINRQNLEAERWKGSAVFWVSCGVYTFDIIQAFSTAQMFSDTGSLLLVPMLRAAWGVAGPELSLLLGSLFAWGRLDRRGRRHLNRMRREAIVAAEQQMGGSHFVGAEPIPPSGPIPTYHPLANQQAQTQAAQAAPAGQRDQQPTKPGQPRQRTAPHPTKSAELPQIGKGNAGLNPFGGDAA